ncbi:MAG: hypothetical protein WA395_13205 [Nitrososphaeraceae archaeon]
MLSVFAIVVAFIMITVPSAFAQTGAPSSANVHQSERQGADIQIEVE